VTAIDDFFTHYYRRRPVNATFTGVHAYDDRLPDWSPDGLAAQDDEMRSLGDALATDYPAPSSVAAFRTSPDLLDAELARGFLEIQRAEIASLHGPRGNPALWTGEAVFSIISLMIRDFAPLEERVEAAIARMEAIPEFLCHSERSEESRSARKRGPSTGQTAIPRFARNDKDARNDTWITKARRDCDGAEILLTTGLARWLESADLDTALRRRALAASERARSAFHSFAGSLSDGVGTSNSAPSCGPELYDLLLSRGHCCTRSRGDLLAEARERIGEARAELDRLATSVAGSFETAQARLADDHPKPNDYLGAFDETWRACRESTEAADAVSWPDWPIRYVPYPPWTADAAPYLYYLFYRSPAPFDPYTTYDYVVPPLPDDAAAAEQHLRSWNNSTIKLNHVVHHGAIGHHVQNWYAYHQRRSRVGTVAAVDCANRIGMFCGGTMAEGWACYATDLMEELGFLTPLERVSQQHTRVRMLARAIVDIELHQGTISFAEAAAFYQHKVGMHADAAKAEAVKNSMFPCTAIMYWLGTQGIHDLRDEMQRREGSRFSLRRFHGELLGFGSVPVPLVARMLTSSSPLPG
jgi:hypothetical protein